MKTNYRFSIRLTCRGHAIAPLFQSVRSRDKIGPGIDRRIDSTHAPLAYRLIHVNISLLNFKPRPIGYRFRISTRSMHVALVCTFTLLFHNLDHGWKIGFRNESERRETKIVSKGRNGLLYTNIPSSGEITRRSSQCVSSFAFHPATSSETFSFHGVSARD